MTRGGLRRDWTRPSRCTNPLETNPRGRGHPSKRTTHTNTTERQCLRHCEAQLQRINACRIRAFRHARLIAFRKTTSTAIRRASLTIRDILQAKLSRKIKMVWHASHDRTTRLLSHGARRRKTSFRNHLKRHDSANFQDLLIVRCIDFTADANLSHGVIRTSSIPAAASSAASTAAIAARTARRRSCPSKSTNTAASRKQAAIFAKIIAVGQVKRRSVEAMARIGSFGLAALFGQLATAAFAVVASEGECSDRESYQNEGETRFDRIHGTRVPLFSCGLGKNGASVLVVVDHFGRSV